MLKKIKKKKKLAHRLNQMNPKSAGLISFHFHCTTIQYKSISCIINSTKAQDTEEQFTK